MKEVEGNKLEIEFIDCWIKDTLIPETDRWLAVCNFFKIVVTGATKQEAFEEVMTSIRVHLLYCNKLTDLK